MSDIGEIIKATRKRKGMKQKNLAKEVLCNSSYLAAIENGWGGKEPSIKFLKLLAKAMNCNLIITFEDVEL